MKQRQIAVLGGGNGAHAAAAHLASMGQHVRMFEMPQFKKKMQKVFDTKTITLVGEVNGDFTLDVVTDDIDEAVNGAELIFLIVPAYSHPAYAKLLKGRLNSDQILVTMPGAFAALKMKKEFGDENCPILVDTNDLMYDTRLEGEGVARILEIAPFGAGVMPVEKTDYALDVIRDYFGVAFVFNDVLECGLAIINPALHSGPCILNAGPIEYKCTDFYLYEHGFTPSAAKVNKALDNERKAVAAAFGYDIDPFKTFPTIYSLWEKGEEWGWSDLYTAAHGDIGLTPIQGPNDINSRYLTEDAPCGLVPWANLGKIVGVETKIIDSIVNIYSVFHEKDWWTEGVSLEDLGIEGMGVEEIKKYAQTGVK